jgi:hypothetical protein
VTDYPMKLFNKPRDQISAEEQKSLLEIYELLVDMADKVSQRRQNANNFYLSVNTAITGASAYLSVGQNAAGSIVVISIAGLVVSLLWKRNIDSYKDLNSGKFHVITDLEKALPISPFTAEWNVLQRGKNAKRYRPFHAVEVLVPFVFAGVHLVQFVRFVPWSALMSILYQTASH